MLQYWSWILTAVGVFGLWLAGRRNRLGWAVGLGAQGLWIAYALTTQQYGFLVSAFAYGGVYATNLRKWKAMEQAVSPPDPAPQEMTWDALAEALRIKGKRYVLCEPHRVEEFVAAVARHGLEQLITVRASEHCPPGRILVLDEAAVAPSWGWG